MTAAALKIWRKLMLPDLPSDLLSAADEQARDEGLTLEDWCVHAILRSLSLARRSALGDSRKQGLGEVLLDVFRTAGRSLCVHNLPAKLHATGLTPTVPDIRAALDRLTAAGHLTCFDQFGMSSWILAREEDGEPDIEIYAAG